MRQTPRIGFFLLVLSCAVALGTLMYLILAGEQEVASSPTKLPSGIENSELRIEGLGMNTIGGSGGTTYIVKSLEDSGPYTLRDYLNKREPRTIRFGVSGTLVLKSYLEVTEPFLTIDGSHAPDQGVAIRGFGLIIGADNVIVRNMRFRTGRVDYRSVDTIQIAGNNVVVDHCSVSWGDDGNIDIIGGAKNVTIQWSIISENIGPGSMLIAGGQVTVHHCLFASNPGHRDPALSAGDLDFVNNVIYNWPPGAVGAAGPAAQIYEYPPGSVSQANFVGNYFKAGPNTIVGRAREITAFGGALFLEGNIGLHRSSNTPSETEIADLESPATLVGNRFGWPTVTTSSAKEAYDRVLANAGAVSPCRDDVDTRILTGVMRGSGRIISDPHQTDGWPDLTRPCAEVAATSSTSLLPKILGGSVRPAQYVRRAVR